MKSSAMGVKIPYIWGKSAVVIFISRMCAQISFFFFFFQNIGELGMDSVGTCPTKLHLYLYIQCIFSAKIVYI